MCESASDRQRNGVKRKRENSNMNVGTWAYCKEHSELCRVIETQTAFRTEVEGLSDE